MLVRLSFPYAFSTGEEALCSETAWWSSFTCRPPTPCPHIFFRTEYKAIGITNEVLFFFKDEQITQLSEFIKAVMEFHQKSYELLEDLSSTLDEK